MTGLHITMTSCLNKFIKRYNQENEENACNNVFGFPSSSNSNGARYPEIATQINYSNENEN